MVQIRDSHEHKRGCGFRKGGGMYLIGGKSFSTCGKLPYPLKPCPHCGQGLKFHRGFGWFNPREFIDPNPCNENSSDKCQTCPMSGGIPERAGIMWVGNQFYTPQSFLEEAFSLGLSKRLSTVPRELLANIGKTRVYLAHNLAYPGKHGFLRPGIFTSFVPHAIEYVVTGSETEEQLTKIEKRGINLVRVHPIEESEEEE